MRIVVTGGTGLIGKPLVQRLRDRGDDVRVVSRRRSSGFIAWDDVEAEIGPADAVVHLAGEPIAAGRWTRERFDRIRASRVDTTARIARAMAADGAGARRRVLVSASAVGIYGMREDDEMVDEQAPPGADALGSLGAAWEEATSPARKAGARVVCARMGMALGLEGGALASMLPAFRSFVGGPLGHGQQWVSWIHVVDAVRALAFALDTETLSGPVNIVAPQPVTMNELARALGKTLGRPSVVRVPAVALRLALGEGLAGLLLTGQRAVPRKLLDTGFVYDHPALSGALSDLLER
jgi:uncharacterized protein (TIGR01777 family)